MMRVVWIEIQKEGKRTPEKVEKGSDKYQRERDLTQGDSEDDQTHWWEQ